MGRGVRGRARARCLISVIILIGFDVGTAQGQAPAASERPSSQPQGGLPIDDQSTLERAALIERVLAQNPSLAAARAAQRVAGSRIASARAFDDLMVSYSLAPASIGNDRVRFGQTIELAQALPFPGKRARRAEVAQAAERALSLGVDEARRQLALDASQRFDRYYFATRALAINGQHIALLESLKQSAEAQYVVGRASQQDALQAEVELGQLLRERLTLEAEVTTLVAELNALLHRPPEAALPPPASLDGVAAPPPESAALQAEALAARPELAALRARIAGVAAAEELAKLGFYPDLRVMGTYSSMWMDPAHQWMVGVSLNLPIFQLAARRAEVEGARAERENIRADEAGLLDAIRADIHRARAELVASQAAVALYRTRVLPASRDQVAVARAGFTSGRNSFQAVIAAERALRTSELQLEQAVAATHTYFAALSFSVGRFPVHRERGVPSSGEAALQPVSQP